MRLAQVELAQEVLAGQVAPRALRVLQVELAVELLSLSVSQARTNKRKG